VSAPLLDRVPPQNLEAEQATLGAMLMERDAIARVVDLLDPEDFYSPQHQILYRVVTDLFNESRPVDVVTVVARLQDVGQLESVGGRSYLISLQDPAPTAAAVEYYARIVREKATLIRAADEVKQMAQNPSDEEIESVVDRAESRLFSVGERTITPAFTPLRDLLGATYDRIDEMQESHRPGTGLLTGFEDMDSYTAGLQPSELVIIAARPSMGKTSFVMNIATHIGKSDKVVAVFSLEMAKEQLVMRMLCCEAGVNQQNLRQGYLDRGDMDRIAIAANELYNAPVYFDDSPTMNVLQIRGKARRLRAERGLDLIILDYLQLVSGHGRVENRNQEISQIARALKSLARELHVPVIACSQLSRAVESRGAPHRPMLSDLRESGSIEQDADVVMFLYRPSYYGEAEMRAADYGEEERHVAEVILAKQRNGPTGTVRLAWLEQFVRFENLEGRYIPPEEM
jgi:replicative DNA helicase